MWTVVNYCVALLCSEVLSVLISPFMESSETGRETWRQLTGNLQTQGPSLLGLGVWLLFFELVLLFVLGSSLNQAEVTGRRELS